MMLKRRAPARFGRAEEVMPANMGHGRMRNREILPAAVHECTVLPVLLTATGVECVIAGGGDIQFLEMSWACAYAGQKVH